MLELSGVRKAFGGIAAVDGVDLTIERGRIFGLIGPNGAGKTTLFNLISGLARPDAGKLRFEGRAITGLPPHRVTARGIARTFQNLRLFGELSAADNVMIGLHCRLSVRLIDALTRNRRLRREEAEARRRAHELLALVGLAEYADVPAGELAYGVQRRLEIARALASKPKLLLLDEPAAGMNESESAALMSRLRLIQSEWKLTLVIIEHDMRVVMGLCEEIAVLNFGRVIATGSPTVIRHHPEVIAAYLGEEAVS